MSRKPWLVAPPGVVPMPLRDARPGDYWPFRGRLRAESGAKWPYPKEWERMFVVIRKVGEHRGRPYVIEVVDVRRYQEETSMGHTGLITIDLKPPGRGWERAADRAPGRWMRWQRRRWWEAE